MAVELGAARVVRAAALEVRVHAGLLRRQPMCRVVLQQSLEELKTGVLQARDQIGVGTLPLGESGLEVGKRGDARPGFLVGGAEHTIQCMSQSAMDQ